MGKLRVGDEVLISRDSKYYKRSSKSNPCNTIGVITDVTDDKNQVHAIIVKWKNGFSNCYHEEELTLVKANTKDLRKELSDAIDTLIKYSIAIDYKGYSNGEEKYSYSIKNFSFSECKDGIIDKVLPITPEQTPEQLEVEEIEKEMKKLTERLAKVKERM